jgi:hypothetical protein
MIRISFTVDGALHIPLSTKLGTKSKLFLFFWCVVSCVYINLNIYICVFFFGIGIYIKTYIMWRTCDNHCFVQVWALFETVELKMDKRPQVQNCQRVFPM